MRTLYTQCVFTDVSYDMKTPRNFIQSLAKGISVLRCIAVSSQPLQLGEIAKSIGTTTTSAIRLCYTLHELGLIQRDQFKRYHLTPDVLSLGYFKICSLKWLDVANYYLEILYRDIQETVDLSVLDGCDVLYLIRIKKEKYVPYDVTVGTKLPVYCTSMGRVLMAFGSPQKTQSVLNSIQFRQITHNTITSNDQYVRELDVVRSTGYGISDEDFALGHRSIAVPLLGKDKIAFAAINVAVPSTRYSRDDLVSKFAPCLMKVAKDISDALQKLNATNQDDCSRTELS